MTEQAIVKVGRRKSFRERVRLREEQWPPRSSALESFFSLKSDVILEGFTLVWQTAGQCKEHFKAFKPVPAEMLTLKGQIPKLFYNYINIYFDIDRQADRHVF